MNTNFTNLRTKAGLLEKKGDAKAAAELRAKALTIATEVEMNAYGYQLLGEKKVDEAIAIFQKNVKDHPKSWNTYDSLAEAYGIEGKQQARGRVLRQGARADDRRRAEEAHLGPAGEAEGVS